MLKTVLPIAILLFLILCLVKWIYRTAQIYLYLSKLPGPRMVNRLVGNLPHVDGPPEFVFRQLRQLAGNYYPAYKIFALHKTSVNIVNAEDCETILAKSIHNEKSWLYDLLHSWLKLGLLTSSGEKWQTRRRILTPAFHFNILQQFVLVFNEEAEKLVEVLKTESKKSYIEVTSHISQFTLKTIAETAMGTKLQFKSKEEMDYKQSICTMGKIVLYGVTHPYYSLPFLNMFNPWFFTEKKIVKTLHRFTKNVINERKKNVSGVDVGEHDVYLGRKRQAMLDLLLSAKQKESAIDDDGIQEEVDTFMFEGHDTTAVALDFVLMLISNHENVQNKLVEEMEQVLKDIHKKPNFYDLQNLKYMERVIKESLRLYPSVQIISRVLGEDVKGTNGLIFPKNSVVCIHIYDIHHNAHIYPEPEKFDPDRFLPENCQNRHPFAYLPFSAGPRNCIGQKFAMLEMKAALCAILGNFVLEKIDTPDTIELMTDLVLRPKDNIKIRFVSRVWKK